MTDITLEQRAATVPPTTAVTFVPAFSEAARMLGFAQATGSEDGVAYWGHIVAEYEVAAKAALRLSAGADWQPIDTAPKDGLIDIWIDDKHGGTRRCDCHYDSICREWRTIRPDGRLLAVHERHVTHWMPRPAAPRHEPGEG